MLAKEGIKSCEVRAVVYNADGTVKKDLGVVSFYHASPIKMAAWNLMARIKSWLQ